MVVDAERYAFVYLCTADAADPIPPRPEGRGILASIR